MKQRQLAEHVTICVMAIPSATALPLSVFLSPTNSGPWFSSFVVIAISVMNIISLFLPSQLVALAFQQIGQSFIGFPTLCFDCLVKAALIFPGALVSE